MSLYVLGDPHLSFGVEKPMDIFQGWGNHVEKLENNWKHIVREDDTVILAGDISWGMKIEETVEDFRFLESLPGKKIILKGNHDYWWDTKTKIEKFFGKYGFKTFSVLFNNAYLVDGVAICGTRGWFYDAHGTQDEKIINREVGRLKTSIEAAKKLDGEVIVFLHYPPVFAGKECPEIMNVLLEYDIKKCYYGHLHGKHTHNLANVGNYKGIEFKLIACDYTQFKPIHVT